jgi:hypothetical protein
MPAQQREFLAGSIRVDRLVVSLCLECALEGSNAQADDPSSGMVEESRRPDSNRGPLHYE